MTTEAEGPDQLEKLKVLAEEIHSHRERLEAADDNSPETTAREMSDTVMSLMDDLGRVTFNALLEQRTYLHDEVEPLVVELAEQQQDDDEPYLEMQDAALLISVLSYVRPLLEASIEKLADSPERAEVEAKLAQLDKAVKLVNDLEELESDEATDDEVAALDEPDTEGASDAEDGAAAESAAPVEQGAAT